MSDLSPLAQIRIACGTSTGVATLTTISRIIVRTRKSQLWVDDVLAIFSMCTLIVQLVASLINPSKAPGAPQDHDNGAVRYYLISNMFYAVIWSARLSILFSIIRITRGFRPNRHLAIAAALFLLAWVVLTAQLYWECETETAWKHAEIPQCKLDRVVAICQLITDIISDGILLAVPVRLVMIIQDNKLRYRLILIFGTCVITTIASFVHAAFLFEVKEVPIMIAAVIESAISLVVCNIPILATAIVKMQQHHDDTILAPHSNTVPRFWGEHEGSPINGGNIKHCPLPLSSLQNRIPAVLSI
ncbi:hypothetical protein P691DRAFT_761838 [Macrolepiota fuliginosa MF-IS2]|uniref:Rhodopsin domain-containing protein n=1 Tax=Macrolepiota fuliginosa MF-IS2 TaxID=1400762 RepID=A0A9P6C2C2_9AGAR|nr:hypothetical protein P691DRAFT_761838 [Macrolepiota fuliginosa MF-IS2]